MPIYEYQCKACGAHHEAIQKMADAPLKKCPECGKSTLQRLISAPVFRLKGGGWYETDFKSDQEKKRNLAGEDKADKSDSSAAPASAKSADAAAESKPAAKPEPAAKSTKATRTRPAAKKAPVRKAPAKKAAKRR